MSSSILLITQFNESVESLIVQFAELYPKSTLGKNLNLILNLTAEDSINKIPDEDGDLIPSRPNKIMIEQFILNVLEYKDKIDNKDESFFLEADHSHKINEKISEHKGNKDKVFDLIDEFKNVWYKLSDDNKEIVFMTLSYLCDLALNYFAEN